MNLEALRPLADHLWQSSLFAVAAGLLTLALGRNRARVRHGVWLAASCKFLIPVSALIAVGGHFAWRTAPEITSSLVFVVANEVSQPFAGPAVALAPQVAPRADDLIAPVLLGVWALGFAGIACSWFMRWRKIREVARAGSPVDLGLPISAISSSSLPEPGIFGLFRPVLLLPDGIREHLSPAQFNAVIAHELCHVRHRDNLVAAFQMFVETVFWFHPLVWWIGKRMVAERERACDEEVLRLGNEPNVYAESILRVCALYVEAPLRCVPGVTGADLKKRVQAIVARRAVADLSPARKAMLTVLGLACLTMPVLIGMLQGAAETSLPLVPPAGVKLQSVSIERCKGYVSGEITMPAPGTFVADCQTTVSLIDMAWLNSPGWKPSVPQSAVPPIPISGQPVWAGSGNYRYRIEFRGDGRLSFAMMLQALLADRFALKIRRVSRESPMYALKVAKGGVKLQAAKEGVCSGAVSVGGYAPPPGCFGYQVAGSLQYGDLEGRALRIEDLCSFLAGPLGRPVIDKTGVDGRFDFHLKFAREGTPAALGQLYPPLSEVLENRFGLKLEPITGSREFLVVDRIEKPIPE